MRLSSGRRAPRLMPPNEAGVRRPIFLRRLQCSCSPMDDMTMAWQNGAVTPRVHVSDAGRCSVQSFPSIAGTLMTTMLPVEDDEPPLSADAPNEAPTKRNFGRVGHILRAAP
jgi:hypothetical protein